MPIVKYLFNKERSHLVILGEFPKIKIGCPFNSFFHFERGLYFLLEKKRKKNP